MEHYNENMMTHYRRTKIEHIKDLMERTEKSLKYPLAGLGSMPAYPMQYDKAEWHHLNSKSVERSVLEFLNELEEIKDGKHAHILNLTDFARMVYYHLKADMKKTDYSEL